jgi:hypothetical protein
MRTFEATESLAVNITQKHVKLAKEHRHDKKYCVISQALRANKTVSDAVVGASITTVTFTNGRSVRYCTPPELKEGLTYWDRTGDWKLPVGTYHLEVPKKHQTRLAQRKANKIFKERREKGVFIYMMGKTRKVAVNPRHIEFQRRSKAA